MMNFDPWFGSKYKSSKYKSSKYKGSKYKSVKIETRSQVEERRTAPFEHHRLDHFWTAWRRPRDLGEALVCERWELPLLRYLIR